jgi:hypothetical protein
MSTVHSLMLDFDRAALRNRLATAILQKIEETLRERDERLNRPDNVALNLSRQELISLKQFLVEEVESNNAKIQDVHAGLKALTTEGVEPL